MKKVFFYRVCGTGMAQVALLLQEMNYQVSGGDHQFYPPISTLLENKNFPITSLKEVNLKEFDVIVVGNVVAKGSEDAQKLEASGTPLWSFPHAMRELVLKNRRVVGISGTHGKTTTTYLLVQILQKLGKDPGYLIGGMLSEMDSVHLGNEKDVFVIEADEYDSSYFEKVAKFHLYGIDDLILTSLEYDHADIYESFDVLKQEFTQLVHKTLGRKIFCAKYEELKKFSGEFYGDDKGPIILREGPVGSVFEIFLGETRAVETNLVGEHNILNLSAAMKYCVGEGEDLEKVIDVVAKLNLVKRRQELKGSFQGVPIIDDFAHHPTAIAKTLEAIIAQYQKPVLAVYAPHSATGRSNIFQNDYPQAFKLANEVIFLKAKRNTSVKNTENLDYSLLQKSLKCPSAIVEEQSALVPLIQKKIHEYDKNLVVLVMSNGDCFGFWETDFISNLDH